MSPKKTLSICIGRFQPVHLGHLDLLQRTLELGDETLVFLGSACQVPSPTNPFTWQERAEMLRRSLTNELLSRTHFLPLQDCFDTHRWAQQLAQLVQQFISESALDIDSIIHLGAFNEPSVRDNPFLATWKQRPRERLGDFNSTLLRDWLFSSASSTTSAIHTELDHKYQPANWLHPTTLSYLSEWKKQPVFTELADQWQDAHYSN